MNVSEIAIVAAKAAAASHAPVTIWGTIPTWITAAGVTGFVGVVFKFLIDRRKSETDARKVDGDLDNILTGHAATELASLRQQITGMAESYQKGLAASDERYRSAMKAADEREEQCQKQVAALREQVDRLREEVNGLRRNSIQTGLTFLGRSSEASDDVLQAASRAFDQIDAKLEGNHDAD